MDACEISEIDFIGHNIQRDDEMLPQLAPIFGELADHSNGTSVPGNPDYTITPIPGQLGDFVLFYKDQYVGHYSGEGISVSLEHQGKGLGAELVVEAIKVRTAWPTDKKRQLTLAGENTLKAGLKLYKERYCR